MAWPVFLASGLGPEGPSRNDSGVFPYSARILTKSPQSLYWSSRRPLGLFHVPPMADDERLAGQCIGLEAGAKQYRRGNVRGGRKFTIHRVLQHHVLDHLLLADTEFLRLLGDLLDDQRRAHKTGTDDIGSHIVRRTLLGDHPAQTQEPVLGGDVG